MVCSACGHESPAGNRFCGMCGTPLPHRPLSIPGAQGTIHLTRGPLEHSRRDERSADGADELSGAEDPLKTAVEDPAHASLTPADEMTATGETSEILPNASAFLDALATAPAEPSTRTEVESFPWMEDVLGQIAELEAAQSAERPSQDAPSYLSILDELPLLTGEFDTPTATVATPSFVETTEQEAPPPTPAAPSLLEVTDAPQEAARADAVSDVPQPSGKKWRIWLATAAVLVFAALGTIQWRTQRNRARNTTAEVVDAKAPGLEPSNPANTNNGQSGAHSHQADTSSPASPLQDHGAAAKASAPASAPSGSPEAAKPTVPTVASQAQGPPPTGPGPTMTQQLRPADKAPPSSQSSAAASDPANQGSSKTTAAKPAAQAPPAVESPKSAPGALEMNKAKNASDKAAEAVWLWKATAKGNPDAPVQLADMYIKGDGVPRSCEQALVLLKTAAIRDNARACNRLAAMYGTGTCVQRNHVEAYRWLSSALATNPNSQSAQQNRDLTWKQMTPEERAQAQKYR